MRHPFGAIVITVKHHFHGFRLIAFPRYQPLDVTTNSDNPIRLIYRFMLQISIPFLRPCRPSLVLIVYNLFPRIPVISHPRQPAASCQFSSNQLHGVRRRRCQYQIDRLLFNYPSPRTYGKIFPTYARVRNKQVKANPFRNPCNKIRTLLRKNIGANTVLLFFTRYELKQCERLERLCFKHFQIFRDFPLQRGVHCRILALPNRQHDRFPAIRRKIFHEIQNPLHARASAWWPIIRDDQHFPTHIKRILMCPLLPSPHGRPHTMAIPQKGLYAADKLPRFVLYRYPPMCYSHSPPIPSTPSPPAT